MTEPTEPRATHGPDASGVDASGAEPAGDGQSFGMPTSQPILLRALRWEVLGTVALAVVFGVIGVLVSGGAGAVGGVLGALLAGVLSGLTIGSIAFANQRFITSPNYIVIFFAIVVGGWLFKLIAFIVVVVLLKDQTWLDSRILFFGFVAGILVSLAIDTLVMLRSRQPILPGA